MPPTRRLSLLISALAALSAPAGISAQLPEKVAPYGFGPQDQIELVSFSGITAFGNAPIGPYTGRVVSMPGQPLISLYSVDYKVGVRLGSAWTANVSEINLQSMQNTKLGILGDDSQALSRYQKAAWLASQFTSNLSVTAWTELASAIWTVALNGDVPSLPYYGQYGNWLNLANAAEAGGYRGFNFNEWRIVTDITSSGAKLSYDPEMVESYHEALVRVTVTPEPETMILLLSGLLVLGVAWRRGIG
jgi:hypothetical protein